MLYYLIELLILRTPKRHGWTWQRYAFAPVLAAIIFLTLIYLAFSTAKWWLAGLLALLF